MSSFLKQHNIHIYSTNNEGKAVVVERLNRTFKQMMWKQFTVQGNQKWVKMLPEILANYNNKIHSSIKTAPEIASKNPEKIKDLISKHNDQYLPVKKKAKFKLNDRVRIYKYQYKFNKGFVSKWTDEIFRIVQINYGNPSTYVLQDMNGEIIDGAFYENELIKTAF